MHDSLLNSQRDVFRWKATMLLQDLEEFFAALAASRVESLVLNVKHSRGSFGFSCAGWPIAAELLRRIDEAGGRGFREGRVRITYEALYSPDCRESAALISIYADRDGY